jgi:hypothetical protein
MKTFYFWLLAIVITLGAAAYQHITGPTNPKKVKVQIDNKDYQFKLIRSHGGTKDAPIELNIDKDIEATLYYRGYPAKKEDAWTSVPFARERGLYVAKLPNQPPAGKLMYYLNIKTSNTNRDVGKDAPVVIRFKGDVPTWVLLPHVIFMFLAMFFSNLAGILAATKSKHHLRFTYITFALLALGGMILGPIVQFYAFGEFWTGVPFGWDLTDNKTLIAFVFYLLAVLVQFKSNKPHLTVIAAIVMLIVFSIPHSALGSELDRATGHITQGMILVFGL